MGKLEAKGFQKQSLCTDNVVQDLWGPEIGISS